VFDDDAKIVFGDLDHLLNLKKRYDTDITSCAQDTRGKVSHKIHIPHEGNHILRYVNFIELNFPVFKIDFLIKFMNVYDGILSGWGIDHWYSQLGTGDKNMAIVDKIMIYNPRNSNKINNLISKSQRKNQWINCKQQYNLKDIVPKNLGFLYE
jgi:hypothetical protein